MDCKSKASLKLDDILPLIGEFGKFQILFDIVLCFMQAPGVMLLFLPYFSQHSPSWRCVQNSTNCALNGSFSSDSPDFGKRCNMSRADWEFTELKSYSIVTQVLLSFSFYLRRGIPLRELKFEHTSIHL